MNAKQAAIKILENAKKALKEKLEKAEGKNTAQLNEFKGIPQPPAPKAPEKAIAPTPKIPQPKMPGLGRAAKPLSSFMKKKEEKLQSGMAKARVDEGKSIKEKQEAREPASAYKIVHHSKMDPKVKEDFHRKNKNMSLMNRSKKITKSGL